MLKEEKESRYQDSTIKSYLSTEGEGLQYCLVGWLKGTVLICSEVSDTLLKARELITLARQVYRKSPFRLCCTQLNPVDTEWDVIHYQHQAFTHIAEEEGGGIIHLSTPSAPSEKKSVKTIAEAFEKLPKMLNAAGWVELCAWYNEKLEEAFSHFVYSAVDEYTLERYLKDFQHEAASHFLQRTRRHLLLLELSLGTKEKPTQKSYREIVSIEKELILIRGEMERFVKDHYTALKEIVRLIPIIEKEHPEFTGIQRSGQLMKMLLDYQVAEPGTPPLKWGRTEMLLQLLNDDLGAVSAVCGPSSFSLLAFAIRCALLHMKALHSKDAIFDFVLNPTPNERMVGEFRGLVDGYLLNLPVQPEQERTLKEGWF